MINHHRPAGTVLRALLALALAATACSDSTSPLPETAGMHETNALSSSQGSTTFTVLARTAVTCTNGTIVGDVGTLAAAPTGSVTLTSCPVSGALHVGDAAATAAFNGFLDTYAALAPDPADACTVLSGTLAGVTLAPGSYCFPAAAALTGTLTLNGPSNGIWSLKIGT